MDETLRLWGRNIAARRKALGLSQETLAELLEVDQSTVSKWERGAYEPRRNQKVAIAGALSSDVSTLFPLVRGVA